MSNPTNPFSWQMPTPTDLVTDLPADFEVFGQAVATSLADLLGGTTGQVLSKTTNADMDFTWVSANPGDITEVTVSSPITGGGSSGSVNVAIQDGTTAQKGAVQLENSTASTSTTTAAVPASVKSAYDLANAAIAKSIVDAKGDLIVGTANDTVSRLAVGATNGHILTVDSAEATGMKWAAAAGGGKVLQVVQGLTTTETVIASTTYTDTTLTASITPSAATSKILVIFAQGVYQARNANTSSVGIKLLRGSTDIYDIGGGGTQTAYYEATGVTAWGLRNIVTGTYLDSPSTTSSTTYKTQGRVYLTTSSGSSRFQEGNIPSTIILMEIGA